MKKQTITRKLLLSKKTVAHLDDRNMNELKGGVLPTMFPATCKSLDPYCRTNEMCSCVYSHCA